MRRSLMRSLPLVLLAFTSLAHAGGELRKGENPAIAGVHEARPEGVGPPVVITPDKGYVDDAFVFDEGATRLAWVQADTEGLCKVHLTEPATGKDQAVIDLAPTFKRVSRLRFVKGGSALLVIGELEMGHPVTAVVGLDGKVQKKWDKVNAEYARVDGKEIVIDWQSQGEGGFHGKVRAFDVATGKPFGKSMALAEDKDGKIAKLKMVPLYWRDGHRILVGKKEGAFDKKTDQRESDTLAAYDVLAGKFVSDTVIADLPAFRRLTDLRSKYAGKPVILAFDDQNALQLLTADDKLVAVSTAQPLRHYQAATLVVDADVHAFSLTIDPVNPDAVKKQQADPVHLDLYTIDPATGATARVARVPGGGDTRWQLAGKSFALLHKHKGFDRGGPTLEIYPIK